MEFIPLYYIPKNSKCTYSFEKRDCLHFGNSSLHSKIVQPILGDQECCKGFLKCGAIFFFENPFPFPFLFLLCCFFSKAKGFFFPLLLAEQVPPNWAFPGRPARVDSCPAPLFW